MFCSMNTLWKAKSKQKIKIVKATEKRSKFEDSYYLISRK